MSVLRLSIQRKEYPSILYNYTTTFLCLQYIFSHIFSYDFFFCCLFSTKDAILKHGKPLNQPEAKQRVGIHNSYLFAFWDLNILFFSKAYFLYFQVWREKPILSFATVFYYPYYCIPIVLEDEL